MNTIYENYILCDGSSLFEWKNSWNVNVNYFFKKNDFNENLMIVFVIDLYDRSDLVEFAFFSTCIPIN